jgi:hypothetical protein
MADLRPVDAARYALLAQTLSNIGAERCITHTAHQHSELGLWLKYALQVHERESRFFHLSVAEMSQRCGAAVAQIASAEVAYAQLETCRE